MTAVLAAWAAVMDVAAAMAATRRIFFIVVP
jgi:hypothetical protein